MRLEEALSYMENCIKPLLKHDGIFVLAIDGRCAAGKTTFAKYLAKRLSAAVIATDDFFLPQSQSENKLRDCPFDKERFMKEVLLPLKEQTSLCYHRFDCHTQSFVEARHIELHNGGIVIIEGAYIFHPSLHADWDFCLWILINRRKRSVSFFEMGKTMPFLSLKNGFRWRKNI